MKYLVIKGRKRDDMWDWTSGQPVEDTTPIGYVLEIEGSVPESYIKYEPNRIFDRRKYPDLYNLFGKAKLPSENELKLFTAKHSDWYITSKKKKSYKKHLTLLFLFVISIIVLILIK